MRGWQFSALSTRLYSHCGIWLGTSMRCYLSFHNLGCEIYIAVAHAKRERSEKATGEVYVTMTQNHSHGCIGRLCRTTALYEYSRTGPQPERPTSIKPRAIPRLRRGGRTCSDIMAGHLLHLRARPAMQVTLPNPPGTARGPMCLAHALRPGRAPRASSRGRN